MEADGLTEAKFLDAFKKVVAYVKQIEAKNLKEIKELADGYKRVTDLLTNNTDKSLGKAQTTITKELANLTQKVDKKMSEVKDGTDGLNGLNADEDKVIKKTLKGLIKEIPSIKKIIKGIKKEKIRDALENLEGDERLEISAVKGLEEALNKARSKVSGGGLNVGSWAIRTIDNEDVGTGDGSTVAFTIDHTPSPSTSLHVLVGNSELFLTDDFTYSAKTITFLTAPPNGAKIRANYRRQ